MILVEKAKYKSCWFLFVKRSKNYNAVVSRQNIRILFVIVFYCLTSIFCFVFARQILDVFTIFSELSGLKRNVLFMEIYIYQ